MIRTGLDGVQPAATADPRHPGLAWQNRTVAPDLLCLVRWASLSAIRPQHVLLLSPVERGRRDTLRARADRDRFTLGAALLRLAVADQTGTPPDAVPVDRTCPDCTRPHGRPRISGSDVHVSVSHSGGYVAVAVTRAGPVGIDVEQITALEYEPLLRQVLAPAEAGMVRSVRDFFVYWARKESALKATGDGLTRSMTELVVSSPDAPARLVRYGTDHNPATAMCDLVGVEGYACALTVLGTASVDVDERDATALLAAAER